MNGFRRPRRAVLERDRRRVASVDRASTVRVSAPADITRVACFQGRAGRRRRADGPERSRGRARSSAGDTSTRSRRCHDRASALPARGASRAPRRSWSERWSASASAFSRTPVTVRRSRVALLVLVVGGLAVTMWRRGRDRPVQGLAGRSGDGRTRRRRDEAVPMFERNVEAPVEFAPPEDLRPGQVGHARSTSRPTPSTSRATIVDLAVRGYLMIEEIPKDGMVRQGRLDAAPARRTRGDDLLTYERRCANGLFQDGDQVDALGAAEDVRRAPAEGRGGAVRRHRLARVVPASRPTGSARSWVVIGSLALSAGIALTIVLATLHQARPARHPVRRSAGCSC